MEENKRLYLVSEEVFKQKVLPVIKGDYIWKGRPPKVTHYKVFCGILYTIRTDCPWRDLPPEWVSACGIRPVLAGEQERAVGKNPVKPAGRGKDKV